MLEFVLLGLVCIVIRAVYLGTNDNLQAAGIWLGMASILGLVVYRMSFRRLRIRESANSGNWPEFGSMAADPWYAFGRAASPACLLGTGAFVFCLALVPRMFARLVNQLD